MMTMKEAQDKTLEIVDSHINNLMVYEVEAVARGLLMTSNPAARSIGSMMLALMEVAKQYGTRLV